MHPRPPRLLSLNTPLRPWTQPSFLARSSSPTLSNSPPPNPPPQGSIQDPPPWPSSPSSCSHVYSGTPPTPLTPHDLTPPPSPSLSQVLGTPVRTTILDDCATTPIPSADTCAPTIHTAIHTTTYTVLATRPHSCYTYTDTALASCRGFDALTCGPVPACLRLETTILTVPCADACCPTTPTATVTRCSRCQTGCAVTTQTLVETTGCAATAGGDGVVTRAAGGLVARAY